MLLKMITIFLSSAVVSALAVAGPRPVAAETLSASYIESRVVLALDVPDAAAEAWLPEQWSLFTLPKGPFAGANLLLVLADRHLQRDADGQPTDPPSLRAAVFASFGLKDGNPGPPRLFVTRVYTSNASKDPYGVAAPAQVQREMSLVDGSGAPRIRTETWAIAPVEGGELRVTLSHEVGPLAWKSAESQVFSARNPDFSRIYRDQQLDGLAMSAPLNRPLAGNIELAVDLPEFEAVFDGSEKIVGIVMRPMLVREVFLP